MSHSRVHLLACAALVGAAGAAHPDAPPAASTAVAVARVPSPPFSEATLPRYVVRRAASPPAIDGRLDEFDWAAAPQINGFERILNDYGRVQQATRARMLWDDDALYLGFACHDADMWALYDQEDDPMWAEEVVEAFIDPDGDGKDYLELEVNPLNAVVDLHIVSVQPDWVSDKDWDIAGLRTAVRAYGTVNDSTDADAGWTVEIAIPWSAFGSTIGGGGRPEVGDRWRLNLYRIERGAGAGARSALRQAQARQEELQKRLEDPQAGGERDRLEKELTALTERTKPLSDRYQQETEYTAWSPTYQRGFHHPQRFGIVEFAP